MMTIAKIFQNRQGSWTCQFIHNNLMISMKVFETKNNAIAYAFSMNYTANEIQVA